MLESYKTVPSELYPSIDTLVSVKYGFDMEFAWKHNQTPYFSITTSDGAAHDKIIAQYFPELVPLLRWHLCVIDGLPMYYEANSLYWAEAALNISKYAPQARVDPLDAFISTCIFGAIPGESLPDCLTVAPWRIVTPSIKRLLRDELNRDLTPWLRKRLPALQAQFMADMQAFGTLADAKA